MKREPGDIFRVIGDPLSRDMLWVTESSKGFLISSEEMLLLLARKQLGESFHIETFLWKGRMVKIVNGKKWMRPIS